MKDSGANAPTKNNKNIAMNPGRNEPFFSIIGFNFSIFFI